MIGEASAPASSGNLGPGFDSLALALSLRCTATAESSESMTLSENGSTTRLTPNDMIYRAVDLAVGRPMHITLENDIPRARGLGSSSAVCAAAAAAALKGTEGERDRRRVAEIVAEIEEHPEQAAAAVFGGLVAASSTGIKQIELHESWRIVVGIPDDRLKTSAARRALPEVVPLDVVGRTIARVAFLISGLQTGDEDALANAGGDEIHEQARSHLSPVTGDLISAARRAGAAHACWSGAGPTALAFTKASTTGRVVGAMGGVLGMTGEVLTLKVDYDGLI